MKIATYLDKEQSVFLRLKRKTSGEWKFLVSGEWSESPYHDGNVSFYIRHSSSGLNWSILSSGFPNRIVAAAEFDVKPSVEQAAAMMLIRLKKLGGEYIDFLHASGNIDDQIFFQLYENNS